MSTPAKQDNVSFEDVSQMIWRHLEERDWHAAEPRSLAISIVLEATELLEHYQWQDASVGNKDDLAEELADIFIYAFQFAQANGINIPKAITKKLAKAAKKYPAEHFKNRSKEDRKRLWIEDKLKHNKAGL